MTPKSIICVGAIVTKGESVLAVRQAVGHSLEGQWTIPWGRLEEGESPSVAAVREVKEESGVIATVDGLAGVQELPLPWSGWIALVYFCSHVDGCPVPDNRETDAARFLTLQEFEALNDPIEPWSQWLMHRVLRNDCKRTDQDASNPYSPSAGFI